MQPNGEPPAKGERPLDDEERDGEERDGEERDGEERAARPADSESSSGSDTDSESAARSEASGGPVAEDEPVAEDPVGDEPAERGEPGVESAVGSAEAAPPQVTWGLRRETDDEEDAYIPGDEADSAEFAAPAPLPPPARDAEGNLVLKTSSAAVLIGVAALAAAAALIHLGMVFLHVAPPNTVSNKHASAIDGYIYPEFEQNWKLFAPNPLQQNIAVHVRVETRANDGSLRQGGWVNLTAYDAENIRGNLLPSHTAQNELRRAWDFFTNSHDEENKPTGPRGKLASAYVKRVAMLRLGQEEGMDTRSVQRLQFRSATTPVQPPEWANETIEDETKYRTLPWWNVTEVDVPEAAR